MGEAPGTGHDIKATTLPPLPFRLPGGVPGTYQLGGKRADVQKRAGGRAAAAAAASERARVSRSHRALITSSFALVAPRNLGDWVRGRRVLGSLPKTRDEREGPRILFYFIIINLVATGILHCRLGDRQ